MMAESKEMGEIENTVHEEEKPIASEADIGTEDVELGRTELDEIERGAGGKEAQNDDKADFINEKVEKRADDTSGKKEKQKEKKRKPRRKKIYVR